LEEERIYQVSKWLLALVTVIIPLSILILVSALFAANYPAREWTRFLLFAAWMCWTISMIAGVVNIVGFFFTEESGIQEGQPVDEVEEKQEETGKMGQEEQEAHEKQEDRKEVKAAKDSSALWSASLMGAQAAFFMTGVLLYVAFCAYMVLPSIAA
jgi:hypothetical protein